MWRSFAVIILGGTGQAGGAAVAELLTIPECREVVMVTRKTVAVESRVPNVVLDTGAEGEYYLTSLMPSVALLNYYNFASRAR